MSGVRERRTVAAVATDRQRTRCLERIDTLCAGEFDAKTLRVRVLDEISHIVAFDAYVWLLTDPSTAVGCAPLADVACLSELPRLIKFKYLSDVNRWTSLARTGPAARSLRQSTQGDPSRSLLWREVMSRYGIGDVASAVFSDRFGCWAFLDLWRDEAAGPFTDNDTAFLSELAPPLTEALRTCQATTFNEPAVSQRHALGPLVLLLDTDLNIVSQTAGTHEWLSILLPHEPERATIPSSVYNVAGQLLARESGVDAHDALARVHLAEGFWVTLRAARLAGADAAGEAIAVTLEKCSPVERMELFVRSFALSPREGELMNLLATGGDTRDLAQHLNVSEHTVQDHLKSIFTKTGTRNRSTVLSRALGTRPESR